MRSRGLRLECRAYFHAAPIMPWMITASLLFATMGVCVKLAAEHYSTAELVFYRGFISWLLVWLYLRHAGIQILTPQWRLHVMRSLAGLISLVCYFLSISQIHLATAVTLNYTSPLFLAILLAWWEGERLGRLQIVAICCGFLGVVLLLRPTLAADQLVGALYGLASGLISSIAYLHVRKLAEAGEPAGRTVYWFSLITALAGLPWVLGMQRWFVDAAPSPLDQLWSADNSALWQLVGVGVFGALAQLFMTRAYATGKTLAIASLAYTTVVFSTLYGYFLWDERLPLMALAGMLLIILSGIMASAANMKRGH